MDVRRRAAIRRAQATAGGCTGRVDRHVVNGLAESVGEGQVQPLLEAPPGGDEQTVVVRITTRILEEDLAELRIGAEEIPRERDRKSTRLNSSHLGISY